MEETKQTLKEFILKEYLPGENPAKLTETTPLISGGIIDSFGTLKLVLFLEEKYGIQIEAHKATKEHLDTILSIAELVHSKLEST